MNRLSTVISVGLAVVFPLLAATDAVAISSQGRGGLATFESVTTTTATTWKVASYSPPKKPPPKRSTGTGTR